MLLRCRASKRLIWTVTIVGAVSLTSSCAGQLLRTTGLCVLPNCEEGVRINFDGSTSRLQIGIKTMSLGLRSHLLRSLLFTTFWFAWVALPWGKPPTSIAREFELQEFVGAYSGPQDAPGQQQEPGRQVPDASGDVPQPVRGNRSRPAATKKGRRANARAATAEKAETESGSVPAGISFRNDVAPILVANCVGCHSQDRPGMVRGKLDLTSFAKLMQGTPKEKVIEPGKPDDSHLILRVKGEETPRMPQGGNNNGLSAESIGKIEAWIKAGAKLDAGLDPKAAIESYAARPEQVRRNQIARLSTKDREQKVIAAGLDRWKQTNPKLKPEVTRGQYVILFANLPKDRAAGVIKTADAQHGQLKHC